VGRHPQHPFRSEKGHKLYKDYLDELVLGDALATTPLVVNEHHSTFYSLMPSCSIIAGALIARTRQARNLRVRNADPRSSPIRTGWREEYAMLDVM